MAFDPKDLNAYKDFLNTQQKISETITKGTKSFAVGAKDALKAANDLRNVRKDLNRLGIYRTSRNKKIGRNMSDMVYNKTKRFSEK